MSEALTSTGIEALDLFLKGGLPKGFTTLLLAPSGAGAEIFAKQFCAGQSTERAVYVTTDESAAEVQAAAREAGWSIGHVQVVDLQTEFADAMLETQQRAREGAAEPKRFDPRDLIEGTSSLDFLRKPDDSRRAAASNRTDYLGRLVEPFQRLKAPDRVAVHSLDFFLNLYTPDQVVAVLTALKAANSKAGGLMLWVLAKGAHGATVERRLELLSDCLIELEVSRKGTTFERYFMVKKVKNRSYGIGVSTYEVTDKGFMLETLERIV